MKLKGSCSEKQVIESIKLANLRLNGTEITGEPEIDKKDSLHTESDSGTKRRDVEQSRTTTKKIRQFENILNENNLQQNSRSLLKAANGAASTILKNLFRSTRCRNK